jgi:hypothetical protein
VKPANSVWFSLAGRFGMVGWVAAFVQRTFFLKCPSNKNVNFSIFDAKTIIK